MVHKWLKRVARRARREIAALVARGYLPEEARDDPVAIKAAIQGLVSDLAFELEQDKSKGSGSRF
jgi:hypothetical protein